MERLRRPALLDEKPRLIPFTRHAILLVVLTITAGLTGETWMARAAAARSNGAVSFPVDRLGREQGPDRSPHMVPVSRKRAAPPNAPPARSSQASPAPTTASPAPAHSGGAAPFASPRSITLAWDPVSEPDLAGYRLYVGKESGRYESAIEIGTASTYRYDGLQTGVSYYFAVSAVDRHGNESRRSSEVTHTASAVSAVRCDFIGRKFVCGN